MTQHESQQEPLQLSEYLLQEDALRKLHAITHSGQAFALTKNLIAEITQGATSIRSADLGRLLGLAESTRNDVVDRLETSDLVITTKQFSSSSREIFVPYAANIGSLLAEISTLTNGNDAVMKEFLPLTKNALEKRSNVITTLLDTPKQQWKLSDLIKEVNRRQARMHNPTYDEHAIRVHIEALYSLGILAIVDPTASSRNYFLKEPAQLQQYKKVFDAAQDLARAMTVPPKTAPHIVSPEPPQQPSVFSDGIPPRRTASHPVEPQSDTKQRLVQPIVELVKPPKYTEEEIIEAIKAGSNIIISETGNVLALGKEAVEKQTGEYNIHFDVIRESLRAMQTRDPRILPTHFFVNAAYLYPDPGRIVFLIECQLPKVAIESILQEPPMSLKDTSLTSEKMSGLSIAVARALEKARADAMGRGQNNPTSEQLTFARELITS